MFKFLLMVGAVVAGIYVFQQMFPDLQRYLRLRSM